MQHCKNPKTGLLPAPESSVRKGYHYYEVFTHLLIASTAMTFTLAMIVK